MIVPLQSLGIIYKIGVGAEASKPVLIRSHTRAPVRLASPTLRCMYVIMPDVAQEETGLLPIEWSVRLMSG